jgi:tRNA uridine 5-carboxymethylaminomethyl modification enzyme
LRVLGKSIEHEYSLHELLRRPDVCYADLMSLPGAGEGLSAPEVIEQIEIQAKYQGYIERQQDEIERSRAQEALPLPRDFDYTAVHGLSVEAQQKLTRHQPETLGHASRLSGITPAAISVLLVHLKRTGISAQQKKSA